MKKKFCSLQSIVIFPLLIALASCSSAGVSDGDSSRTPEEVRAARLLKRADQFYLFRDYSAALKLSGESLAVKETFEGYYMQGSARYQLGQMDASMASYKKAQAMKPLDEQLLMSMATLHTAKGETEESLALYMKLTENYPKQPVYPYKAGSEFKKKKDFGNAKKYLKQADVPSFKFRDRILLELGDIAVEEKKYDEAETYFASALKVNPSLEEARKGLNASKAARVMEKGEEAFRNHDYKTALGFFEEAVSVAPESGATHLMTGMTQLAMGKPADARKSLTEALRLNPQDYKSFSLLGSAYHGLHEYEKALQIYKNGLTLFPEAYELQNKMGLVYMDRGDIRPAIDSFDKSIRIKSDYAPAHMNLALAYLKDKRYDDARKEFKNAKKLDSSNPELKDTDKLVDLYISLDKGDRFFQSKNYDKALKEYLHAKKIKDDQAIVFNSIARVYFEQGNYKGAEKNFNSALEKDPKNIYSMQGLLRVYSKTKNYAKGKKTLAMINQNAAGDVSAVIALGRMKEDEGRLKEAEAIYQKHLKEHEESEELKNRLGFVYYKMGMEENDREKYERSLALLKKAKKFNPNIPLIDESMRTVKDNDRFRDLLPLIKKAEANYNDKNYNKALFQYQMIYAQMKRPLLLVRIAECYIAMGYDKKALAMLNEAAKSEPSNYEVLEAVNTYLLKKGEVSQAEKGFEGLLEKHQDAYYSHYKLGVIQLMGKKYDRSIESLSRALIYKPDFGVAKIVRGVAYYKKGDKKKAKEEFEDSRKDGMQRSLATYNLAVILYNDDLMNEAAEIFEDLIEEDKSFLDARYYLAYIYFKKDKLDKAEKELLYCVQNGKDPSYYNALALVYKKKYEATRNPEYAAKLRNIYQDIIREFPGSDLAGESQTAIVTLNPDTRVIYPYPIREIDTAPLFLNGDILVYEEGFISLYDASSKKQKWKRALPGVVRLTGSHVIYAIAGNKLYQFDPATGEEIQTYSVPEGATDIFPVDSHVAVSASTASGTSLTLYDVYGSVQTTVSGKKGSKYFYSNEHFYRQDQEKNKIKLVLLNGNFTDSEKSIELAGKSFRFHFLADDRLALLTPSELYLLKSDSLKLEKKMQGSFQSLKQIENRLYLASGKKILIADLSGNIKSELSLRNELKSADSFEAAENGHLIYIGKDSVVRMMDRDGKEIWSDIKIPEGNGDSAFTLYY